MDGFSDDSVDSWLDPSLDSDSNDSWLFGEKENEDSKSSYLSGRVVRNVELS